MNAVLALLGDLYQQITVLQQENQKLQQQLESVIHERNEP